MRWAGNGAHREIVKVHTGFWQGNLREGHLEHLDVDGSIILKRIL